MKLKEDFGVRALLGTIIVAGAVGTLAYLSIIEQRLEALTALIAMGSSVVAFYYGQKSKGGLE